LLFAKDDLNSNRLWYRGSAQGPAVGGIEEILENFDINREVEYVN